MILLLEDESKVKGIKLRPESELDLEDVRRFFCTVMAHVEVQGAAHILIDNGNERVSEPRHFILKKAKNVTHPIIKDKDEKS